MDLTKYLKFRPYMKVGDAITWKGKGLLSYAISLWTPRTHASAIFQPVKFEGEPDRVTLLEAWEGEFNLRGLRKRLETYEGEAYWHQLRPEFDEYREDIGKYLFTIIGTKYDYEGLLANMFGYVKACDDKLWCSEAVGFSLLQIKLGILEKYLPNKYLKLLLSKKALRPGGIAQLPVYLAEVRLT